MEKSQIQSLAEVAELKIESGRKFFSATPEEIISGATSDIYFVRTHEILRQLDLVDTPVTAEAFCRRDGIFAGIKEVMDLLADKDIELWALPEGSPMQARDIVLRITGPYGEFGIFETPMLGFLASSSGWATAAREVKEAAAGKLVPVLVHATSIQQPGNGKAGS